jgi:hypothetical protein
MRPRRSQASQTKRCTGKSIGCGEISSSQPRGIRPSVKSLARGTLDEGLTSLTVSLSTRSTPQDTRFSTVQAGHQTKGTTPNQYTGTPSAIMTTVPIRRVASMTLLGLGYAVLTTFTFCCCFSMVLVSAAKEEEWQGCQVFLAPSTLLNVGHQGVYAARSFQQGDIVEISSGFLPMSKDSLEIKHSVLEDYAHTYWRGETTTMYNIVFGRGMMYNHHPTQPNVELNELGMEPSTKANRHSIIVIGFMATRDISVGEELYITYGGQEWFQSRGIDMQIPRNETSQIELVDIPKYKSEYCSKIYGGIGRSTWTKQILPLLPEEDPPFQVDTASLMAPLDSGLGDARAKVMIKKGDRVEISTGLVLSRNLMKNSAIGALTFSWDDLQVEQQRALRNLRRNRKLELQHQEGCDGSERTDTFKSYEDLAVLPTGTMALVRRVGGEGRSSNCRLRIHSKAASGSKGVILELIATKKIKKGEVLKLDLPPAGSRGELALLKEELERTGQPYYSGLFSDVKDEL